MNTKAQFISYGETGAFSKIVTDYLSGNTLLQSFYKHPVSIEGIKAAIEDRKHFKTGRQLLVNELQKQYRNVKTDDKVTANITSLLNENTFTITTAHQPNIFTGHLYFVYKILHTVKLAEELTKSIPGNNFVPVFYMGSEDADLEELGHVYLFGEKHEWKTNQTGAVGRMKVDKALLQLMDTVSGQLLVQPFGEELIHLLKSCYREGVTIEQAAFKLVNALFSEYGVLVFLPDNPTFKKAFIPVIEKELKEDFSHKAVQKAVAEFPSEYKVQASGRELNLFYLTDHSRERIEMVNGGWSMVNRKGILNATEIKNELNDNPERFSPNVILRPVFQEMLLPNVAFIGGGGEIAYWLELIKVFEAVDIPFPVLILRNSFILISKEMNQLKEKLCFDTKDLFKKEPDLFNELVKRQTKLPLSLEKEKQALAELYHLLKIVSGSVDPTLVRHTEALQAKALNKINILEKKMLRAEKRKYETQRRQLHKLKSQLFPNNSLQERIENIMPFYAKWGKDFIHIIYENSLGLEQQFCIINL